MKKELNDIQMKKLYEAFEQLETAEEYRKFLRDLCTSAELKAMAQRFAVAVMLRNKMVYSEIAEKTGASSATICRVNQSLNEGAGGYKIALDRIGE